MIAEASGFLNSYRIPLGRRLNAERKIGFHGAAQRMMVTAYREKMKAGDDADSPANVFKLRGMIGAPQEKHMITIFPTGGGKFRSVLVRELLTYPGPNVCQDINGEASQKKQRSWRFRETSRSFSPDRTSPSASGAT